MEIPDPVTRWPELWLLLAVASVALLLLLLLLLPLLTFRRSIVKHQNSRRFRVSDAIALMRKMIAAAGSAVAFQFSELDDNPANTSAQVRITDHHRLEIEQQLIMSAFPEFDGEEHLVPCVF